MPSFDMVVNRLVERQPSAPALVHSIRVRSPLTMHYWDYLAWAIERRRPRRLLLLGLGGGTMLQLLERREVVPPCVAIDLDSELTDLLREQGWLTYPQLTILHEDARRFVGRPPTELFDAIIVDVYDEHGYVQELYADQLSQLVDHLTPDGVLLLHCLDPMAKFAALRVVMPRRPPSPSCSTAQHLVSLGMSVAVYPMWSTALIASSRDPGALDESSPGRPSDRDADDDAALAWSSQYYASRHTPLSELERFLAPLDGEYSYANLQHLERHYLAVLAMATPMPLRSSFQQALGLPKSGADQRSDSVRELLCDGARELTATTVRAAMALKALLEQTIPGAVECQPFVAAIREAIRAGENLSLSHIESFAVAWSGDFRKASAILDEDLVQ